jgi:hypothetical protein
MALTRSEASGIARFYNGDFTIARDLLHELYTNFTTAEEFAHLESVMSPSNWRSFCGLRGAEDTALSKASEK